MASFSTGVTYRSTRGAVSGASFEEVVLGGLAPDRGLYVPETIPTFSSKEVKLIDVYSQFPQKIDF